MNVQRKRIKTTRVGSSITELATDAGQIVFTDAPAVNLHGVHIDIGMSPFGPDESLEGRWYVAIIPKTIASDAGLFVDWLAKYNTVSEANTFLNSSEFIWGSGAFICAEQAPFNTHFAPKTSRNLSEGSALVVIVVADAVSGVVDNWDAVSHVTLFTSS